MAKPKQFLKDNKKKSSKAPQVPQTADEYLAAGVEFEEAGEKWRGGDAAKSTRFFVRAIDCYDEALKKFSTSFDLAYNKARVQYELTQHPKLAGQLPAPLLDLLQTALESSRYALALNQDNADVLFNTAQVLTSLVEALNQDRQSSPDSLKLLEEAIELFQRCLTLQEFNFAESQALSKEMGGQGSPMPDEIPDSQEDSTGDLSSSPRPAASEDSAHIGNTQSTIEDDRWALAVEPVTHDTLLDTLLAQLETLTTLCGLLNSDEGRGLAWIEEYSTNLIQTKLVAYVQGTSREEEAGLTRANFIAAMADANYRSQKMDIKTYERAITEAYGPLSLDDNAEGLCDKAEALLALDSALRLEWQQSGEDVRATRWKTLSAALQSLTMASKIAVHSSDNTAKIHLIRGDIELLRFRLGDKPWHYEPAAKNSGALMKNAGTFYRGAEAHAEAANQKKELQEAIIKGFIAGVRDIDDPKMKQYFTNTPREVLAILEEAAEEGLVLPEWLQEKGL